MREYIVPSQMDGVRLDRFVHKMLPGAAVGLINKSLRKKNITLSGRRAEGSERVRKGDCVRVFFSDETIETLSHAGQGEEQSSRCLEAYERIGRIEVAYEDADIVIPYKPAGLLVQPDATGDSTLDDWLAGYLLSTHKIDETSLKLYTPSAINRLDRGTQGLVLCAATISAARLMSGLVQERRIDKYYTAVVRGRVAGEGRLESTLSKDARNTVSATADGKAAASSFRALSYGPDYTVVEVLLITGRSHQIRVQFADAGHPILGDRKYGDEAFNKKYGESTQLLAATGIVFPKDLGGEWERLSGLTINADCPAVERYRQPA